MAVRRAHNAHRPRPTTGRFDGSCDDRAQRNEPLLTQLIHQLGVEGRATEMAVYSRIQRYLRTAKHNHELARPFSDLSTTANVCFTLPGEANILLERIIEKAEVLVREMENRTDAIH